MYKKNAVILFIAALLALMLAGCTKKEAPPEPITLKIMVDNSYNFHYEPIILGQFPHVTLNIIDLLPVSISRPEDNKAPEAVQKRIRDLILSENPDLFYNVNPMQYGAELVDLEPLISRDRFPLSDIHKYHIETYKANEMTVNQLSPTFDRSVLFINRKLFEYLGVDLPPDPISWGQLRDTAQLFAGQRYQDKPAYGYFIGSFWYQMWSDVGAMHNMRLFDRSGKLADDLSPWHDLLEQLVEDALSGTMLTEGEISFETMKQTAMFIGTSNQLNWLTSNNEQPDDWSIVCCLKPHSNMRPYRI